jgi:L-fuculose-phosphate aldolase
MSADATRASLLEICQLVYDRQLTNAAGSNFSTRASESTILVTTHGNAKRSRLRMNPEDLLLMSQDGTILEGEGEPSSSWPTHLKLYEAFPEVGAVIHAHPKLATVLACGSEPMPAVLDAMVKYGPVSVVPRDLVVDSPEFGDWIVEHFRAHRERLASFGLAVFYAFHGVLVAAPDLDSAYDLLERMEFNAAAVLFGPQGAAAGAV